MNFRRRLRTPLEPSLPVVPLIAVTFLLLMFYRLQLKELSLADAAELQLPLAAPADATETVRQPLLTLRMTATPAGELAELRLGETALGADDAAFERLNERVRNIVGRPGDVVAAGVEVEIDADDHLKFEYVNGAIASCTGRLDPSSRQLIRYVDQIRFRSRGQAAPAEPPLLPVTPPTTPRTTPVPPDLRPAPGDTW